MQFISSTLVEFEQLDLIPVESGKLLAQMRKMQAFYYELYDSYLRGGKYIVRYMFYTLSAVKRVTRAQLRKQFAAISRKAESVLPEDMQAMHEEPGKKESYSTQTGAFHRKRHSGTSVRQDCHNPYRSSRKPKPAPCPSSRKLRLLCLPQRRLSPAGTHPRTAQPASLLSDCGRIPDSSAEPHLPWMCRRNLKLMQAMTLYQLTVDN